MELQEELLEVTNSQEYLKLTRRQKRMLFKKNKFSERVKQLLK